MPRSTTCVALAFVAILVGFAGAAEACPGGGKPAGAQTTDSARRSITCLINKQRRHHHLRALPGHVALGMAAQEHSDAMTAQNFFAHDGVDGTPASRAGWAGYTNGARTWGVGENLGFGSGHLGSPRAIVRAWMRSPEHRSVLLMKSWRQIGVGVTSGSPLGADGQDMATYTVDFGYRHG